MAKINKENIYIPDNTLSRGDSWVGTDETTGRTKTYSLGDTSDYIKDQIDIGSSSRGNSIINKGYYNIPDTYNYFVWSDKYVFDNVVYTTYISNTVTLSPANVDPLIRRIDVIVLNNDGTFSVVQGNESANPDKPLINPLTQLEVTFVIIDGNTTAPSNVVTEKIYDENLGTGGNEWNSSIVGTGISKTDTTDPFSGTTHISFANSTGPTNYINFGAPTTILRTNIDKLVFRVKLILGASQSFLIILSKSGSSVNQFIYITDGDYGFNVNNTTEYQTIIIPASDITMPEIDLIYLMSLTNGLAYIDTIQIQTGNPVDTEVIYKTSQLVNDGEDGTSPFVMLKDVPSASGGGFPIITIASRPWELRKTVNIDDAAKRSVLEINDIIAGSRSLGRYEFLRYNGGAVIDFDNNYTIITGI